jgi:hypothetical protein
MDVGPLAGRENPFGDFDPRGRSARVVQPSLTRHPTVRRPPQARSLRRLPSEEYGVLACELIPRWPVDCNRRTGKMNHPRLEQAPNEANRRAPNGLNVPSTQ